MKLSELLYPTEYTSEKEVQNLSFTDIQTNPNKIGEGTLFVLLPGVSYPTERLLPLIFAKRPAGIVTELDSVAQSEETAVIRVPSARRALSYLYFRLYHLDEGLPRLIAVTGTNGKTTTATMIEAILADSGARTGYIGTGKIRIGREVQTDRYYSMTTPDPELLYPALARMKAEGCEYIVMEVSSHALALEKVAPLHFACAIFTNLSCEHLDFHGSMEEYYLAKRKLFSKCELAVINTDDGYGRRLREECTVSTVTAGALWEADARATAIENGGLSGVRYVYKHGGATSLITLSLPGIHNVYNSTLAMVATTALGVKPYLARRSLESLSFIEGRMQTVSESPLVIIDYAHTEFALKTALETINSSKISGQKLITVFGCGGERDREKRPKMAQVAEKYSDRCIVTSDNSRGEAVGRILSEILSGFSEGAEVRVIADRAAAIEYAVLTAAENDIVYIGGKGHEKYTVDKTGYHDFDEEKIVLSVLKKRGTGYNEGYENTVK